MGRGAHCVCTCEAMPGGGTLAETCGCKALNGEVLGHQELDGVAHGEGTCCACRCNVMPTVGACAEACGGAVLAGELLGDQN